MSLFSAAAFCAVFMCATMCGAFIHQCESHRIVLRSPLGAAKMSHTSPSEGGAAICPIAGIGQEEYSTAKAIPPAPFGRETVTVAEFQTLRRRVSHLESMVGDLCGALLHSDDISLLERQTAEIGCVYRDGSFAEFRQPAFARVRVRDVMHKYGFLVKTQPHTWQRIPNETNVSDWYDLRTP